MSKSTFRSKVYLVMFISLMCTTLQSKLMAQDNSFCINLLTKEKFIPEIEKGFDIGKTDYVPYIKVFLPEKEKSTGRAILICPGGGYAMIALGHEGTSWANFFREQGIAVIVLKYRLPRGNPDIPISDTETALRIVQDNSQMWNIKTNHIGIMGFSAGGHLASTIATHTKLPLRPAFQILFYPVITMSEPYTMIGCRDTFLGKNAGQEIKDLYSSEKQVTAETPPAFIVLAADDKLVPPANGIRYFEALNNHNVYASLHVYPTGNHGWGYSKRYRFNQVILDELSLWLEEIK